MKTVHDSEIKTEILNRLEKLTPESLRKWGTMEVDQMLAHLTAQLHLATGDIKGKAMYPKWMQWTAKQTFGFRIPWTKGLITAPEMKHVSPEGFEREKERFQKALGSFRQREESETWHQHPIFGKMNKAEWGKIAYKHIDHHFRQFGV